VSTPLLMGCRSGKISVWQPAAHLGRGRGGCFPRSRIRGCIRRVPPRRPRSSGDPHPLQKILVAPCRIPPPSRSRHPTPARASSTGAPCLRSPQTSFRMVSAEETARENSVDSVAV
jgi:hypothetical protein